MGGTAIISWSWSGKGSKTESSRGLYQVARVAPNIFVGLWLMLITLDIVFLVRESFSWSSLLTVFFGPFLLMGSFAWGLRHLSYRYVSHVKITPEGLAVTRGEFFTHHPWATIGEIRTVPFIQPALWTVRLRDGSPTVAFFTQGSSWMIFGVVKAKSELVDEIRRLAAGAT